VSETKDEIQLQVWKDLALSKQLLANEVVKALDLDSTATATDIKSSLNKLIDRARHADDSIRDARRRADESINELRNELKQSEKARKIAEDAINETVAKREAAENALAVGRENNSGALKKAKADLERKERELKAINSALADTPENVVKKLKNLKKQKMDENTARKAAETSVRQLKKDKKELTEQLEERKSVLKQSSELVEHYRELRKVAEEHVEKLDDSEASLPEQNDELLEGIEMAATVEKDD
jgi:chromosome segregation ATPase